MSRDPAETTVVIGSRWCSRCERAKPTGEPGKKNGQFQWCRVQGRWSSWCKQCTRIYQLERPRAKTPEQREKHRQWLLANNDAPHRRKARAEYRKTPVGKLVNYRTTVRRRLRLKPTDGLRETEADITREIERLRAPD